MEKILEKIAEINTPLALFIVVSFIALVSIIINILILRKYNQLVNFSLGFILKFEFTKDRDAQLDAYEAKINELNKQVKHFNQSTLAIYWTGIIVILIIFFHQLKSKISSNNEK